MTLFKSCLIWALIVALAGLVIVKNAVIPAQPFPVKHDFREDALIAFMNKYHFAKPYYVKEFLACSDRFQTDWRLLPSIALAESSGFKRYPVRTFNGLGWNSANYTFQSIPDSICFVSDKLANGQYYRGKSTKAKLNAYNPNPQYALRVIGFMNEISLTK